LNEFQPTIYQQDNAMLSFQYFDFIVKF